MMRLTSAAYVAGCILLMPWLTAQAAPPAYYPADYSEIVEASKSETGLLVYSNISLNNWDALLAAFAAEYPWIKVEAIDLGANEVFERYYADQGAGLASADILLSAAPLVWMDLIPRDLIEQYQSPELAQVPDWSSPAPGVYTISTDPFVIAYNKLALPEAEWPTSMQQIVDLVATDPAQYQGRLGTYAPNSTASNQAIFYNITKLKGETAFQWFEAIGKLSDVYSSAGPMVEKITTGEYVLGYFLSSSTILNLVADPNRARLIGWELPRDGTVVNMRNFAMMKSSKNPNSARLLVDFILSHKGQTAVGMGGLVPYRSDITDPSAMPGGLTYGVIQGTVGEENIIRVSLDPDMVEGMPRISDRLEAAFAR